jgi:hypothetical protein
MIKRWLPVFGAGMLATVLMSSTPDNAQASDCGAAGTVDPLRSEGFEVVAAKKLYRMQERPWVQIPTGAKILVRVPAGVTEADLHRAATCGASAESPLAVEGAKVEVRRSGDLYELHVTASERGAAREIQRRASAL